MRRLWLTWVRGGDSPPDGSINHNLQIIQLDFMFHNVMFHPTENRIVAVLDWETSTIGHPLADLGMFGFPRQPPKFVANLLERIIS